VCTPRTCRWCSLCGSVFDVNFAISGFLGGSRRENTKILHFFRIAGERFIAFLLKCSLSQRRRVVCLPLNASDFFRAHVLERFSTNTGRIKPRQNLCDRSESQHNTTQVNLVPMDCYELRYERCRNKNQPSNLTVRRGRRLNIFRKRAGGVHVLFFAIYLQYSRCCLLPRREYLRVCPHLFPPSSFEVLLPVLNFQSGESISLLLLLFFRDR